MERVQVEISTLKQHFEENEVEVRRQMENARKKIEKYKEKVKEKIA